MIATAFGVKDRVSVEDRVEQFLEHLYTSVIGGHREEVEAGVRSALEAGVPLERVLSEGLIAAMTEVGRRFECGDFFVPEMLVAARAMQAGLAILRPQLVDRGVPVAGKVLIGTVTGDMHDIGKNLVAMMLEGAGYQVTDLGADVPPAKFVAYVEELKPDILGLSALLTTTMPAMKTTMDALSKAGLRDNVRVIVGGAPITETYARDIGADGFAPDASRAVGLARALAKRPGVEPREG